MSVSTFSAPSASLHSNLYIHGKFSSSSVVVAKPERVINLPSIVPIVYQLSPDEPLPALRVCISIIGSVASSFSTGIPSRVISI